MGLTPVFVTGAAAATCCGLGAQAFWNHLACSRHAGNPASAPGVRRFAATPLHLENRRRLPETDRLTAYLLAALDYDLGAFLSELSDPERERVGVALGSAYGHLSKYLGYFEIGTEQGYQLVNPRQFPTTLPNWSSVSVSDAYSLWGSNTPIASGLIAGLEAVGYAAEAIRNGEEETMIAGGYDEINPCNLRVLETATTGSPGEGVGVLLLQSGDAATASEREPLATCGATVICHGVWWDTPHGARRAAEAVRGAVAASGLELTEIVAVFPSTNGGPGVDDFEAQLLRDVFDTRLSAVDIVPIKPVIGECFSASGPLQCIAAVEYLTQVALSGPPDDTPAALVSSMGYDGTFAATVFSGSPG
ncbi:MAG TPA: beta-ketoacyl synthase N-terminal-like domain-containing protein [Gemmatimonadales bacterium]|jgi:3-oxoacyl-[acyl-carrier-protein] synthase II|nr:beta-ketoacyl synthase N-terminal-like domain-containing protein [Gemmatimonadales bacterium]